jgi:hypothetical protein
MHRDFRKTLLEWKKKRLLLESKSPQNPLVGIMKFFPSPST